MHQRNDSRRESIPARKYLAPFTRTRSFSPTETQSTQQYAVFFASCSSCFSSSSPHEGPGLEFSTRASSFAARRDSIAPTRIRDTGAIRSFHPCDRDFYGRTGATRKRRETGTVRRREQNLECENSRSMNRSEARSSIVLP